jgi:hypothetical protein
MMMRRNGVTKLPIMALENKSDNIRKAPMEQHLFNFSRR